MTFLEEQSRGWRGRRTDELLADQGFSAKEIDLAKATGIACGWGTLWGAGTYAAKEYRIRCLACRIEARYSVSIVELTAAYGDFSKNIEERIQHDFRLQAADRGCPHWAAYKTATEPVAIKE